MNKKDFKAFLAEKFWTKRNVVILCVVTLFLGKMSVIFPIMTIFFAIILMIDLELETSVIRKSFGFHIENIKDNTESNNMFKFNKSQGLFKEQKRR